MRMQLALNVDDLEQAVEYYGRLFDVPLNKREPGYANFVVDSHNLKLVLFEAPGAERLNHVGFEVFDDTAVDDVAQHMRQVALLDEKQEAEVCCYAKQNKAVTYDPQGLMWEWYRVLEDSSTFFAADGESPDAVRETCCVGEADGTETGDAVTAEPVRGCCA